jgi:PAS domain S-box-containing protein
MPSKDPSRPRGVPSPPPLPVPASSEKAKGVPKEPETPPGFETRIERAEVRVERAEARTEQAESRTEQAKSRTELAEVRTEQAESRTEQAKNRTEMAEIRTEQAETRSEQAIRASELNYRRLFEAARDGILILEADTGRISDVNPALLEILGFSHAELVGTPIWELGTFRDLVANQAKFEQLRQQGYILYENLPLETKAGRRIDVEFVGNVYQVGDHNVIQCNVRDITDRKKVEQQLILLNACVSNLNDIVLVTEASPLDEPGPRIVFVNEALERHTGYRAADVIGRSPRFLHGPKTDPRVLDEIGAALSQRQPIRQQLVNYTKDGAEYWVDVDMVPIFGARNECTHFVAIQRDITNDKKREEQLLWKTAFFEAKVHSSPDGILVVDSTGKKILQNQQMIDLWNIPPEFAAEIDDGHQLEWVASQVKNPRQFSEKVAYFYAHPDEISQDEVELINGKVFDRYSAPVRGQDGKYYGRIWSFRDITEHRRSEARFRRLIDSNAQGVLFWNAQGEVTDANDAFLRLVNYTREDLEAGCINWVARTPPEYADLDRRALEELAASGACAPYEKEFIRKDGSRVPILIGAATFEDNPEDGVAFVLDLTERKKLEKQFLRAQRMESIGTLAGGIAHDLNNILSPIMMSIDVLAHTAKDPEAKSLLATIEVSARRGADIVRQVLSFARGIEGERVEVQPQYLLKDLEKIIKDTFPKNIELQFSVTSETHTILGDPTQVQQILLNLCVNARDAMPDGGTLSIAMEDCVLDEQYVAKNIQAEAGRFVKITVTDTGTGVPLDLQDKIFEPFFTTKELNHGTGLGLSTVMAIVKSHKGIINLYSEPGRGTTFRVYLPAMESVSETWREKSNGNELPRGQGETILVVDDEASILAVTRQTLQAFGYHVLAAADGADAVAIYAQHHSEIAIVLTDIMMPIMDGAAMIRVLRRINPEVKIIATSGLNANGSVVRAPGLDVKHFLTKPYMAGTLLSKVQEVLSEA